MALTLTSEAFADGEPVPARFTCDGENVSPPLAWSGAPPATRSFVLVVDDPDAPKGTFTHWIVFDIARDARRLPQGVPPGSTGRMVANSFGRPRYDGPCPPRGHGPHRYRFMLYALDVPVIRVRSERRDQFDAVVRPHVLESATLTGTYERP